MQPKQPDNNQSDDENNENPNPPPQDWRRWMWPGVLVFFLLMLVLFPGALSGVQSAPGTEIPYSQLQQNLDAIESITFESDGNSARGAFASEQQITLDNGETTSVESFSVNLPPGAAERLTETLEAQDGVDVSSNPPPSLPVIASILINVLPFILIIGFLFWMSRQARGQMNGVLGFGQSKAREYDAQTPRVTFDDVAGQDAAKRELEEVVDFLKEPDKYISLGARIPRGVLLIGPPGTGKTLMARAVAGEANVAYYSIAASEFVEMFVGVGASRVRDLFNKAKENSPSIVFIDEIDAVGRQRGAGLGGGNDEREQTLNQMLSELDGFDQSSTVIVMAATNRPDVLDPALLRPGRFDRQVTVDLPDRAGRLSILKIHTRGKPLAKNTDLGSIAGATIGFSGADLANLANEAALNAARHDRKKIEQTDFSTAFERIILGTERPPLSNEEERRVVAYHEAGHALVALLTDGADQVLKVTITPRGQALGVTAFMPESDRRNYPRQYLEARIRTGLGGRLAEEIVFEEITTGAAGDIQQITRIARGMVTQFGMSPLGTVDYSNGGEQPFLGYSLSQGRQYSEETAARVDAEVRKIIEEAYEDVYNLLTENRDKLDEIAQALLDNEVVERDEILAIMGMEQDKPLDTIDNIISESIDEDVVAASENDDTDEDDDPFTMFTDNGNGTGQGENGEHADDDDRDIDSSEGTYNTPEDDSFVLDPSSTDDQPEKNT
jgi:cell division protease FtsH